MMAKIPCTLLGFEQPVVQAVVSVSTDELFQLYLLLLCEPVKLVRELYFSSEVK